jgi:HAD superfamily hydrolase (TIGR01509 family)
MMKMCFHLCLLFISFIYCNASATKKNMVFDFGGVLFYPNKLVSFQHLGALNIAEYALCQRINPLYLDHYLKTTLFTTLNSIAQEHNLDTNQYHQAYDEKGNPLPLLINAWLQGAMTCSEIRSLITTSINAHPEWFACRAEQRLIANITNMIFTPEHFANTQKLSPAALAFIKRCKKEGHKIYGLSNWDAESFALLKEKHPHLFDLFDGIIVSGQVKANKPHAPIYHALLNTYQLEPQQCWFFDDQKENVHAAQQLGINAIVHEACFKKLVQNIKLAHSKSATRRENFKNTGISETNINNTSNAIIDGEKISLTDSTEYNCPPAKA